MPKIKEVYEYNNGSWENGTPIGADASNVDVALSDSTSTRDLQSVLGNVSVSDPSIKTQLTGKVNSNSGDIKDTVVSVLDPSSATDTSENIDSTDVIVAAGESQYTMWSKFNTFRKRVSNKFNNFLISSVEDVVTPSSTKTYSQAALNSYFADVIGYKTDADVADVGSVADQLSTLNDKTHFHFNASGFSSSMIQLANVSQMTVGTQNLVAIQGVRRGTDENNLLIFGGIAIVCSAQRSANMAVFYLLNPWNLSQKIWPANPHYQLARVGGAGQGYTYGYSFVTDVMPYFSNFQTILAGQEIRFLISGIFVPYNE